MLGMDNISGGFAFAHRNDRKGSFLMSIQASSGMPPVQDWAMVGCVRIKMLAFL